jgi:hypothetical protein
MEVTFKADAPEATSEKLSKAQKKALYSTRPQAPKPDPDSPFQVVPPSESLFEGTI